MDFHLILLGFGIAILVVLTGVGGGSLMAPVLIFGAGIAPAVAVGTDLIYAALTKTGALWIHARESQVRWAIAGWMLAGSVPASVAALAALWTMRGHVHRIDSIVSVALGAALILSAGAIVMRDRLRSMGAAPDGPSAETPHAVALVGIGAIVGALVTLSSVGAGSIGVAALMLLAPGLDARKAVGTDLAYGAVLATVAGAGHFFLGTVDLVLLGNLLLGMVPGIYVGGRIAGLFPDKILRRVISIALLGAGLKLI